MWRKKKDYVLIRFAETKVKYFTLEFLLYKRTDQYKEYGRIPKKIQIHANNRKTMYKLRGLRA